MSNSTSPRRTLRQPKPRASAEVLEGRRLFSGSVLLGTTPYSADANVNTDVTDVFHAETDLAVNPTNPLNMVGSASDQQITPKGNVARQKGVLFTTNLPRARVTFDGGHTWSSYEVPFNGYGFAGDSSVSFDADGTVYLSVIASSESQNGLQGPVHQSNVDILLTHSADGGRTWSAPARVASGTGSAPGSPGTDNDKPFMTAWGHGNAVVTWTQFTYGQHGTLLDSPAMASVTHDGGRTWMAGVPISGPLHIGFFAVPTVAADGSMYVGLRTLNAEAGSGARDEAYAVRLDPATGRPLAAPVDVGTMYDGAYDHPLNVNGESTYQDSQFRSGDDGGNITADPTDPLHLAVVWTDMRDNPYEGGVLPSLDPYAVQTNSDVIVSQSTDGGQHWSAPAAVPAANDQFMAFGAFDAAGRLRIGYYDRSYDAANHQYGYTLATETAPRSLQFTTRQVTTALSDPTRGSGLYSVTANPNFPGATPFIGDYAAIAVTPTGVAALWTDMRLPSPLFGGAGRDAFFAQVSDATPASRPAPAARQLTSFATYATVANGAIAVPATAKATAATAATAASATVRATRKVAFSADLTGVLTRLDGGTAVFALRGVASEVGRLTGQTVNHVRGDGTHQDGTFFFKDAAGNRIDFSYKVTTQGRRLVGRYTVERGTGRFARARGNGKLTIDFTDVPGVVKPALDGDLSF